ncbi:MAG: ABC transporter ATP-binding protein [Gemmatimonadota bacterium]|nr:MAG: ABC transporter ATP-binding protein [Gemmatimonadota bacterium]
MARRRQWKLLKDLTELRRVGRLLAPYMRGHYLVLAGGTALIIVLLALRLAQPWPLKWILDGITGVGGQPVAPLPAAVLFLVIASAAALIEYWQVMTLIGLGNRVLYRFRTDLFQHLLLQSLAFHERRAEGELLTRVVYDTNRLRKGVNQILTRLIQTVLTFVATIAVLFWVDVPLALVMGVLGILALALMVRGGRAVKKAAKRNRRREGKLAALVAEDLIAIRDVQTFRPDPIDSSGFQRVNARSLKQESKIRKLSSGMLMRVEIILSAGLALILLFGVHRVSSGAITAGELVLFATYAGSLNRPFFRFARQATRMGTAVASADRLQGIMLQEPEITDRPDALDVTSFRGTVRFSEMSAKRGRRKERGRTWTLRRLDLEVPAGERVAVVGANGSGKSTLLRLILRLADPARGEIAIDGHDLRSLSISSLRSRMSVVFQGSVLFGLTVRENLTLGDPNPPSESEILSALESVDALDLVGRLAEGLDTVIKKRGGRFSVGERQKLAVARAILKDGDLWLLDEPLTGLDVEASKTIMATLDRATRGRTTFWVTHDPLLSLAMDRVLILKAGRVAFFGTRSEFLERAEGDKRPVPTASLSTMSTD